MEINPNHPVTNEMRNQWHKIATFLMVKFGVKEVIITPDDMMNFPQDVAIGADTRQGDNLRIFITDIQTATKIAKEAGGMPV